MVHKQARTHSPAAARATPKNNGRSRMARKTKKASRAPEKETQPLPLRSRTLAQGAANRRRVPTRLKGTMSKATSNRPAPASAPPTPRARKTAIVLARATAGAGRNRISRATISLERTSLAMKATAVRTRPAKGTVRTNPAAIRNRATKPASRARRKATARPAARAIPIKSNSLVMASKATTHPAADNGRGIGKIPTTITMLPKRDHAARLIRVAEFPPAISVRPLKRSRPSPTIRI